MKLMFGKFLLGAIAVAALATMAFGTTHGKQLPVGARPAAWTQSDNDGKKILETACTTCHDLDLIESHHLSKSEWLDMVNVMIVMGATVTDNEKTILVEYLAKTYGPEK